MTENRKELLLLMARMIATNKDWERGFSIRITLQDKDGQTTIETGIDFARFRRLVEVRRGGRDVTPEQLLAEVQEDYPNAVKVEFDDHGCRFITWPPSEDPAAVVHAMNADYFMPRDYGEATFMWKAIDAERKKRMADAERAKERAFKQLEQLKGESSRKLRRLADDHEKSMMSQVEANTLLREVLQGARPVLAILERAATGKEESAVQGLDDTDFLIVYSAFARKQKTIKTKLSRDTRALEHSIPDDLKTFTFLGELTDEDIAKIVALSRQSVFHRRNKLMDDPDIAALFSIAKERHGPLSTSYIPRPCGRQWKKSPREIIRERDAAERDFNRKYNPLATTAPPRGEDSSEPSGGEGDA